MLRGPWAGRPVLRFEIMEVFQEENKTMEYLTPDDVEAKRTLLGT